MIYLSLVIVGLPGCRYKCQLDQPTGYGYIRGQFENQPPIGWLKKIQNR
jgi:hypothetical protein